MKCFELQMIGIIHQAHQYDQATHSIKTSINIRLLLWNEVSNWQISWLFYTDLQNKTLCWLLCTNLQDRSLVTPFARSQKSQHKYIVWNSGWKISPIVNKWVGEGMEKECSRWKKIKKLISDKDRKERLLDTQE